ncbi:MAG: ABC transporter permease [Clostridia bacterium]|nr:ABC transporter permease [Clostridia bacterium]
MLPLVLPVIFLLSWQLSAINMDNAMVLPRIDAVLTILLRPTDNLLGIGSLLTNTFVSIVRVLLGYTLAALVAIPLGMVIGYSRLSEKMLLPFINLFRPIAPLAWVPLVLAWFGISSLATIFAVNNVKLYVMLNNIKLSMLFIIFIGGFFPILTNSIHGVKSAKKIFIDASLTCGADKKDVFIKVLLPSSLPSIVTGLRVGLGVAWMCLVSAEMLPGSLAGVGYLITHAYTVGRTDVVLAGMIAISCVGGLFDYLYQKLEKKHFKWQSMER